MQECVSQQSTTGLVIYIFQPTRPRFKEVYVRVCVDFVSRTGGRALKKEREVSGNHLQPPSVRLLPSVVFPQCGNGVSCFANYFARSWCVCVRTCVTKWLTLRARVERHRGVPVNARVSIKFVTPFVAKQLAAARALCLNVSKAKYTRKRCFFVF